MRGIQRSLFILIAAALASAVGLMVSHVAGAQEQYVQALDGAARDLSGDGQRAVGRKAGPHLTFAVYWDDAGPYVPLFDPEPERFTVARAVDADGSTIAGDDDAGGVGSRMSFQWNAVEGVMPLEGSDVQGGRVSAISTDGAVIFGTVGGKAARWDDGALTIPTPAGYSEGIPGTLLGETADGTMIGTVDPLVGDQPLPGQPTSFLTDGVDVQPLPAPDVGKLYATRVSADGSVVIGSFTDELGFAFPFRWKGDAAGTEFAVLTDLGVDAHAYGVDADGDVIVGEYQETAQQRGAFVWYPSRGLRSLRAVLEAAGVYTSGISLLSARAGSADGRMVAGGSFVARLPEPVPEPGAGACIAVGVGALLSRGQRGARGASLRSAAGSS